MIDKTGATERTPKVVAISTAGGPEEDLLLVAAAGTGSGIRSPRRDRRARARRCWTPGGLQSVTGKGVQARVGASGDRRQPRVPSRARSIGSRPLSKQARPHDVRRRGRASRQRDCRRRPDQVRRAGLDATGGDCASCAHGDTAAAALAVGGCSASAAGPHAEVLQRRSSSATACGAVVAMAGDGINDARPGESGRGDRDGTGATWR